MASPEEVQYLNAIGDGLRKGLYASAYLSIIASGMQLFMCLYVVSVFFETSKELRRGKVVYVAASVAIFSLHAVSPALDSAHMHDLLFQANDGMGFVGVYGENFKNVNQMTASIFVVLYSTVADALLLYRCWIIWSSSRWVCVPPFICWMASIAFGMYTCSLPSETTANVQNLWSAVYVFTAVAVNVSLTALIAGRLIQANKRFRQAMPDTVVAGYTHVAAMLVEAAVPPAIFGLVLAIHGVVPIPENASVERVIALFTVNSVFQPLYYNFVALSSQMIIFRVTIGRSWSSSSSSGATGTHAKGFTDPLRFAHSEKVEDSSSSDYP